MKIAILAAGDSSRNFPIFIDKPKCLYSYKGTVQLDKPIYVARQIVNDANICVIAGYKGQQIIRYVKNKFPSIKVLINEKFSKSAIYSYRTALQFGDDNYLFLSADETVKIENLSKVAESKRKMALLCHDKYYYYSLGFFKLSKECTNLLLDDCYLDMNYMKKVYCFANRKDEYDGDFRISDGVCMGYTTIDLVRRIGKISEIKNPIEHYHGDDIDFIHYDPQKDYIDDLDYVYLTDEYKNNPFLRIYNETVSRAYKGIHRRIVKESKFK